MSGINIGYEIGRGGDGEVTSYQESILNSKNVLKSANVIVGEIVSEIVENASDIAIRASEIGINVEEIKKSHSSSSKMNDIQMDHICSNIVGDIVEHIGIQSPPKISNVIKELNSLSINQKSKDAMPLDVEMKKLLGEMFSPPYEIINYDVSLAKAGVGDQPYDDTLVNEVVHEPEIQKPIEKKSRVTDLVKNSPQLISEYLNIEGRTKQSQDEWEEAEEHLVQVIELDCIIPDEEWFSIHTIIDSTDVAVPNLDDESDLIITDVTDFMDSKESKEEKKELLNLTKCVDGTKGDNRTNNDTVVSVSFHDASTSGEKLMDLSQLLEQTESSDLKLKKKKRNLGRRIFDFFWKGHKASKHGESAYSQ